MKKVLIIDDDASTRFVLYKLMNSIEFITVMADSAELGLSILKVNKDFDLIITDMVMEGMSGAEFVNTIQDHTVFPKIPVIICSGMVAMEDVMKCLNAGVELFVEKPINGQNLKNKILNLF